MPVFENEDNEEENELFKEPNYLIQHRNSEKVSFPSS